MMNLPKRWCRIAGILGFGIALLTPQLFAQKEGKTVVEGKVQDAQNHPVPGAAITLEPTDAGHALVSKADAQGHFRFESVPGGSYTVHAKLAGYQECTVGPFVVDEHETKPVELLLLLTKAQKTGKDTANDMAFSDEPAFTVAGVTDTTALGGHGSGPIVRNSNALSKETASLAEDNGPKESASDAATEEAAIRAKIAHEDNADLHVRLAEIEEAEGRPVDAVQEYQRAAEMQPSESHLFSWGAELLLHHAPEPAIEVFAKGHRLYPQSSRMMLGLGAAWYSQRSKEQAEQIFLQACDLNPSDPTPYLFLGRLQVTEQVVPAGWVERMKRFAGLHPETAMAHYLYAVALMKQGEHPEQLDVAEAELKRAIQLDPHFGDAYLQLGVLCTKREDFPAAIAALKQAVENTAMPDEAHYRLAQVYRRTGDTEKSRQEIALFKRLSEQKDEQSERERHEIPQFVYTLREQGSTPAN
ncbi:MAG: tetratricopeptide repeat protein [Candidatus Acidiferrum sp.]